MSSRPACSKCGSTDFEEEDGLIVCANCGERQEGGPQAAEDDEFGVRRKVARKKEEKKTVKISKVYRGFKARKLYLQAWQYIMWKQCHSLINERCKLPSEIWNIVRDLWVLWLSKLSSRIEQSENGISDNQQTQTTTDDNTDGDSDPSTTRNVQQLDELPTLKDTIALNYLGILLLQHPIPLSIIYEQIRLEQICFIRAIRYVPEEMVSRLPPEYRMSLDTIAIPQPEDLQKAVIRIATLFAQDFGMKLPSLNWTLVLYRYVKGLALPLEVFPAVQKLKEMAEYDFTLTVTRSTPTSCPEAQLMALLVSATKLLFPFNNAANHQYPASSQKHCALGIDWTKWETIRYKHKGQETLVNSKREIDMTDTDVLDMPLEQLDDYMDWFQRTWAQESVGDETYQGILNMFPLQELPVTQKDTAKEGSDNSVSLERLKETQASLHPSWIVTEKDGPEGADSSQPGQQYQLFRRVENLHGPALSFHEEAAKAACISTETLLRAVLQVERRMLIWQHERRRTEMFRQRNEEREDFDMTNTSKPHS